MSLSYGLIKRHGGDIEVESEVGKGTAITIRLPVKKNTSYLETKSEQKLELDIRGFNILVVDDERSICDLLSEFFSKEGKDRKFQIS